jgi:hypothetical protein
MKINILRFFVDHPPTHRLSRAYAYDHDSLKDSHIKYRPKIVTIPKDKRTFRT